MSNSVVKVLNSTVSDSLVLLVNENGEVTPSKDIVDSYLSSNPGPTNLQIMHVNKTDERSIEVTVDNMIYVHDVDKKVENLDEVAYNLYNVNLDHDYTSSKAPVEDDLIKTLSLLEGGSPDDEPSSSSKSDDFTNLQEEVNNWSTINKNAKFTRSFNREEKIRSLSIETGYDSEQKSESEKSPVKKSNKHSLKQISKSPKPSIVTPTIKTPPHDAKNLDKNKQKKDKKQTKPVPDDFALFSTPDIIRRVAGKEHELMTSRPEKIERRTKSFMDSPVSAKISQRLSLDEKMFDKKVDGDIRTKKGTPPEKINSSPENIPKKVLDVSKEADAFIAPDKTPDLSTESNMGLDGSSLDLDPTLLENINSELISEDILYQVAQSLASNTELQNAIDKSLTEDNLVLQDFPSLKDQDPTEENQNQQITQSAPQKGTQIVRPDGRVVIIPPIERPTTRSRNKKKDDEQLTPIKFVGKPLDEEHVSGNELDSSGEEEEESEDDPNKLWCICNQPHNNRFMICCDTCEEWYHGKCVNITKAMGQQMESEGKEWICLFCKDPQLKRPKSAARRIRKASRNSRQSTDSNSSSKVADTKGASVPCVVCQKPSRSNSIFCSEACILAHAQGVERVVVFERATGRMLTGNKAPSAANLEQWLKDHPGYEVVRSAGKIVTTKTHNENKLRLLKKFREGTLKTNKPPGGIKTLPKRDGPKMSPGNTPNSKSSKPILVPPHSEKSASKLTSPVSTKPKIAQTPTKANSTPTSKEKLTPAKVTKPRHSDHSVTPKKQENIRENVQKTIFEQLTNRLKLANDPALELTEDEIKDISVEIESQLYKCFGDTGLKYRYKYRSLIFNIKDTKNQTLWRRICEKTINPYQLVRLSSDDLASQELALWREREAKHQLDMIKKSELELLKCNRQYVLKTHKGEQILEDTAVDPIDNTEVITSLTDNEKAEAKKDDGRKTSSKHSSHKDKKDHHHKHRSSSKDDHSRKRSHSKDKNEKRLSRSRDRSKHKKSSHKSSRHKKESYKPTEKLDKKSKEILAQLVDNKIVPPLEDRVWKNVPQEDTPAPSKVDSDSDHEPTSTVTIPSPPRSTEPEAPLPDEKPINDYKKEKLEVKEEMDVSNSPPATTLPQEMWRGVINMIDVAQISITAHEVSGDCNGLGTELPPNLDIVGRISPDTVWDYIGKMKCSNSKVISVVRLNATNVEEKMPYLALYGYLSTRNRLGVVKSTNKAIKDFYILPLAAQKPIPQALLPLNGPGFEEARPSLLLGIIVRDKRKRPYLDSVSGGPSAKKEKTESLLGAASRSYTPPPMKEFKIKFPIPATSIEPDENEPYSPEDSDPDSAASTVTEVKPTVPSKFLDLDVETFQPFSNKFENIPGLDSTSLPLNTQEIQRQMEKLNKEIEMQKSEIHSISQNIATASTEMGTSALANIALPSNLQQILDSIKTIGSSPATESSETKSQSSVQDSPELTIPLMLPTTFGRQTSITENTIPLNLPKKKSHPSSEKAGSVLSSLSEEDLIRKAEEMLQEPAQEESKEEVSQPPIPGLET